MHELFFSFITNPVHQIRLLQYFGANCVSGLSSASGPNLIYADWKICGDFKASWIRIEADWWPWTAVKSNLCPPLCSAFPLATAQQLLVGILINPIQLRSNLSSNSANMFMEWPQSQCLQAQVAQRLSVQIRVCRDLWQQISPCQQPGREDKSPSLCGQQLCCAGPGLSPPGAGQDLLRARTGQCESQCWEGQTFFQQTRAVCWTSPSPWGSAPSQHWEAAIHHSWWIIPKILLSWLPHGIFSSWQRRLCSAAHRNANTTISVWGFLHILPFFPSSFVGLFLADDNRMLNISFCACLTLTQMGTGAACTCPLTLFEGRPESAVTFYSTGLSLLD